MQRDYLDFTCANECLSDKKELLQSTRLSVSDALEASTIIKFCTRTVYQYCTSCNNDVNEQQKAIIWKAFECGDVHTKLAVVRMCSRYGTHQELTSIIQIFKTLLMQTSRLATLQTMHVSSSNLLVVVDGPLKEQFSYILSVIDRRWNTTCDALIHGTQNSFGIACLGNHANTPRTKVEKRTLWDALQMQPRQEQLYEWITAVCEYCEWDSETPSEPTETGLCTDLTRILRGTVICVTARLRFVGDCDAQVFACEAEVLLAVGHCIATAMVADGPRSSHTQGNNNPQQSIVEIFADELNSQLRIKSYETTTALLVLQLGICGHLVTMNESAVFQYMCFAHDKLIHMSAYREAVRMKHALQGPLDMSRKASSDPIHEGNETENTPSELQIVFARHCWTSTYAMLLSLGESTVLDMCVRQIDALRSNTTTNLAGGSSERKHTLILSEEPYMRGWRALQAPHSVDLLTTLQKLSSGPTAGSLLPLCLIADTVAQALRNDLQAQRRPLQEPTADVASKFTHSLYTLHALQMSTMAPRTVLCLLFDAVCHVVGESCANGDTLGALLATVVQDLVAFLATAARLLRLAPVEVLRTVLPQSESSWAPSARPPALTKSTTLPSRIASHPSSLLGSAVLSHYLCTATEPGDFEQILRWVAELFETEPIQVLLLVNDLPYLSEYLTFYSESVVGAQVNALLDRLIGCRASTNTSCSVVQKTLRVFRKSLVGYLAAQRKFRPAESGEHSACGPSSGFLPTLSVACCEDIERLESSILQEYHAGGGTTALLQLLQGRTDPLAGGAADATHLCRLQALNRLSTLSAPSYAPLAQSARSYLQRSSDLFDALFHGIDDCNNGGRMLNDAHGSCWLITPLEATCCARKEGFYRSTSEPTMPIARLESVLTQYTSFGDGHGRGDEHPLPWHHLVDVTYVIIHALSSSVRVVRRPESSSDESNQCLPDRKSVLVVRAHAHLLVLPVLVDSLRWCLLELASDLSSRPDTPLRYVHTILDILEQCEIPPAQALQVIGSAVSQDVCAQLLRLHLTTAPYCVRWLGDVLCRATSIVLHAIESSAPSGACHSSSAAEAFAWTAPLWVLASCVGSWITEQVDLTVAIVSVGEQLSANCAALVKLVVQGLSNDAHDAVEVTATIPLCMLGSVDELQNSHSPLEACLVQNGDIVGVYRQLTCNNHATRCTVGMTVKRSKHTVAQDQACVVSLSFDHAVEMLVNVRRGQEMRPTVPTILISDSKYGDYLQRMHQHLRMLREDGLQMEDIRVRDFLVQSWKVDPQCNRMLLRQCVLNALLAADPPLWNNAGATTQCVTVLMFMLRENEATHDTQEALRSPLAALNQAVSDLTQKMDGLLGVGDKLAQRAWVQDARQRLRWVSLVLQCTDYRQISSSLATFLSVRPATTGDGTIDDSASVLDAATYHLNCMLKLLKLFRSCKESVPSHIRKLTMLVLVVVIMHVLSDVSSAATNSIDANKHPSLKSLVKGLLAHLLQPCSQVSNFTVELTLLCAQHSLDARSVCQFVDRTILASDTLRLLQHQRQVLSGGPPPANTLTERELNSELSNDTRKKVPRSHVEKGGTKQPAKRTKGGERGDNEQNQCEVDEIALPSAKKTRTNTTMALLATTPSPRDNKLNTTGGAARLESHNTDVQRSATGNASPGNMSFADDTAPSRVLSRSHNSFLNALQDVPVAAVSSPAHNDPAGGTPVSNASSRPDTTSIPRSSEHSSRPVVVKVEAAMGSATSVLQRPLAAPLSALGTSSPAANIQSLAHTPGSKGVASIAVSKKFGTGF